VRLWDSPSGRRWATFIGHPGAVTAVAWSPDGTCLATAGRDGEVRLWDSPSGRRWATFIGHPGAVTAVAWSPDGTRVATAGRGGDICLWDLSQADHHQTYLRVDPLTCLQWGGSGIAVGGAKGIVVLGLAHL